MEQGVGASEEGGKKRGGEGKVWEGRREKRRKSTLIEESTRKGKRQVARLKKHDTEGKRPSGGGIGEWPLPRVKACDRRPSDEGGKGERLKKKDNTPGGLAIKRKRVFPVRPKGKELISLGGGEKRVFGPGEGTNWGVA